MTGFARKALVYITRAHDPKDEHKILSTVGETIRFKQLRWHDFYHFLDKAVDGDTLIEEVKAFMEEQGMATSNRFSATDLATLSGMVRTSEILTETLGGKVRARLHKLAGRRPRREPPGLQGLQDDEGYFVYAQLFETGDMECYLGFALNEPDGYPNAQVGIYADSGDMERAATDIMKRMKSNQGWQAESPDLLVGTEVWRNVSLASLLSEGDHVGTLQSFFVESLDQLARELSATKEERPNLPWNGE